MAKKVQIPTPLRKLTYNEELVEVNAATIGVMQSKVVIRVFAGILAT